MTAHPLAVIASVLAALAVLVAVLAAGELSGGLADIPRHWWSASAVAVPAGLAMATGLAARRAGRG